LLETRYYRKRNKCNRLGDYVFNLEFKRAWFRSCGRRPFILISLPSISEVSRQDVTYKQRRVFSHPFQFVNDNHFLFQRGI